MPRYRGPCPTNAALFNEEKITGVTVHYVTEKLDEGDILLQKAIIISETDDDGRLRQKLAKLAAEMVPELVELFAGFKKPVGIPQDNSMACFAPRPTVEDGYLELATDINTIQRRIRAFNPLPGTSILISDERISVGRFELIRGGGQMGFMRAKMRSILSWIPRLSGYIKSLLIMQLMKIGE